MKYFDEMLTKWGFGDGDAEPDGVYVYRKAYVAAINAFAEKYESNFRAVEFDRPGLHNGCVILFDNMEKPEEHPMSWENANADEGMVKAIESAYEIDVDSFVDVVCNFDNYALEAAIDELLETEDGGTDA